ncbi:MAG: hypothetical protein Kow0029_20700 [Candidatus Rifleibacteriota bacterium]
MNVKFLASGKRRGALMLMLLVAIIIGSIVALRLLPEEEVIARRDREEELHGNLSAIREAFDLKWQADPTWDPDLSNRVAIKAAMDTLVAENYLRDSDVVDPTIPNYLWNTSDDFFWRASSNLASNTSFELSDPAGTEPIASWTIAPGTDAATVTTYLSDSELDDYPHQNKLGAPLKSSGYSLQIVK